MFSPVGVVISCVLTAIWLATIFVDYARRRPRESLLAVLKRPSLIAFVPLTLLGATLLITIMESTVWSADFWKEISPVPFAVYFALSLAATLFSTLRDIAVRDKAVLTAFGAFQKPSRPTNFFVVTCLGSAVLLWATG